MSLAESSKSRDALATLRIPHRDKRPIRSVMARVARATFILLVLAGVGYGGYIAAQKYGWADKVVEFIPEAIRALPEVRVGRVAVEKGRSADAVVVATGYLESRRQAMIGARAAGRIETVRVEEGSPVKSGEIIAVLEHKDMDAALAAAKATLNRSQAELAEQKIQIARSRTRFERIRELVATKVISTDEFDQANYEYQAAVARQDSLDAAVKLSQARVEEAEQFRENMVIRAPFDGTVISKNAEVGESILPGGMGEASGRGSVVTIADLAHLEVDCDVKEDYISRIQPGGPAAVAVDAVPEVRFTGRVRKIIPMGDRARATIKVKVEILDADGRLFPEMSSTVYFLSESEQDVVNDDRPRVFCDSRAIQTTEGKSIVWLLDDDDRAERTPVTVGEKRDERTEIITGLKGGERVILNPPEDLMPKMRLRVRQ